MSDIIERLRDFLIRKRPLLWCCHVRGPDDVIPWESYELARKHADNLNYLFAPHKGVEQHHFDPIIIAAPMVWDGDAKSHAVAIVWRDEMQAKDVANMRRCHPELFALANAPEPAP